MKSNELTAVKDGMPSLEGLPQEVLEKFIALQAKCDALAAENVVLKEATSGHYYWEDGGDGPEEPESFACNAEMKVGEEFELVTGVEIGYTRFRALNDEYDIEIVSTPLQTPDTDAAIAEIKAQGVDEFARTFNSENIEGSSMVMVAKEFAANLRAGRKG